VRNKRFPLGFLILKLRGFSAKDDKLFWWRGIKYKIYEFKKIAPRIFKGKFGDCSIEYPKDPKNYSTAWGWANLL